MANVIIKWNKILIPHQRWGKGQSGSVAQSSQKPSYSVKNLGGPIQEKLWGGSMTIEIISHTRWNCKYHNSRLRAVPLFPVKETALVVPLSSPSQELFLSLPFTAVTSSSSPYHRSQSLLVDGFQRSITAIFTIFALRWLLYPCQLGPACNRSGSFVSSRTTHPHWRSLTADTLMQGLSVASL